MAYLLGIWSSSGTLAQIIFVVLLTLGIVKGIIILPWFKVKPKIDVKEYNSKVHAECPYFPTLKLMVAKAIANSVKATELKQESKEQQLLLARDYFHDVMDKLKTNYLELYKPYNDNKLAGIHTHSDVKDYYCMLDRLENSVLKLTEQFIDRNHFAEQTEESYRTYVEERKRRYRKFVSDYLNTHYDSDLFKISREDLYESNQKLVPVIDKIVGEYFYKVRRIALDTAQTINKLEDLIQDFV